MSYFGKNIRKIRTVKKLSQQAFAELFELKRGTLGAYEEERSEPRIETIIRIANYFSISIDDLLTKELTVNNLLKFKDDIALQASLHKESFATIPCITPLTETDYLKYYAKPYFIEDLPKIQLPIEKDKNYRAYLVSNSDMWDHGKGYDKGDLVIGEFVTPDEIEKLKNDSLVMVLLSGNLVLRKFYIKGESTLLKAENNDIDVLEISNKDILEIWLVKFSFSKHKSTKPQAEFEEKLNFLEKEFMKLKQNFS